jgi:small subunit ribosomal protein S8e
LARKIRKEAHGRQVDSRQGQEKYETGREQSDTTIAEVRAKKIETLGGNQKMRLLRSNIASVSDPKTGTTKKVKVETVRNNKANLHYTRRNIITKGAVIKTELGDAVVTNRPGQDGTISAVLLPPQ